MALPAAAKKQIQEAEKLHQEIYGGSEEGKKPEKSEASPPKTEITEMPAEEKQAAESKDSQEKPESTVTEMKPPQKEEKPKDDGDAQTWEQRYKTLQGMWKKDVPQLQSENQRLQGEIADLRRRFQDLEAQQAAPKEPPKEVKAEKFLTDEDLEEFGPEFLNAAKRAAREELSPTISQLEAENQRLKAQLGDVGSTIQQSERQNVFSQMDAQVEGWRELNQAPEFLNWLQQPDVYSGQTKQSMLTAAFEDGDVPRMKAFFEGFRKETQVVDTEEGVPATRTPEVNVDKLVSPGSPRSTGTPRAQDGSQKIWTNDEIARFYNDVRAGKYKSEAKRKEKLQIETAIIKAGREGRIR